MEWQPIETAPKDGTWIVALAPESIQDDSFPSPYVFTTRWIEEKSHYWELVDNETQKRRIDDQSHWEGYEMPTHWMPLPNLPLGHST